MHSPAIPQEQLKILWKKFVNGESIDHNNIRPNIYDSWQRCKKYNINPYLKRVPSIIRLDELARLKKKYKLLIENAVPVMNHLYQFISGKGFFISLLSDSTISLETVGDQNVIDFVKRYDTIVGSSWAEKDVGTNAICLSLLTNKPFQVFGYEHYSIICHKWTSSVAPIHDPDGNIIGALNITSAIENVNYHTLGMVVMAVNTIEMQLKLKKALYSLKTSDDYRKTIISSISDGLMAINPDGTVTQINQITESILGIGIEEGLNTNYGILIGSQNKKLSEVIEEGIIKNYYVFDQEINIYNKSSNSKTTCLVTSRPIKINGSTEGIIILLSKIERARKLIQRMSGTEAKFRFTDLIGQNPQFLETIEIAQKASQSCSNILVLGESGTGKDVLAQAIHNASSRRTGPFIAINCAALPRELIASELFGYAEGAFTGAKRGGKPGKFELAKGGTIFLDEIGEMPLELQTMLLRVIETKIITRLGGEEAIPVDVRIIAATNKDLVLQIERGNFRNDLFYRLNVLAIKAVPLRERKDDLPLLVDYFLKMICKKLNKNQYFSVDDKVWEFFNRYNWPGNVRELQNIIERAVNLSSGCSLTTDLLPVELEINNSNNELSVENFERQLIIKLLEKHDNNITHVANEMGIARTTLYRKIAKYKIN